MIELGDVGNDGPPVQQPHVHHVGGLQQSRDVELSFSQFEGRVTVVVGHVLVKTVKLDQIRSEPSNDGAEGETRPPGGGEVVDVDPGIALSHLLAPLLQPCYSRVEHGGDLTLWTGGLLLTLSVTGGYVTLLDTGHAPHSTTQRYFLDITTRTVQTLGM